MATSPVVIPHASTLLAEAVIIDSTNTTTVQTLLTVPNGMRCVVTGLVLRNPNLLMTAGRTFSVGFNAAGNDVFAANTCSTLALPLAGTTCAVYNLGGTTNSVAVASPAAGSVVGLGGATLSMSVFSATALATAVKCDVYGYLVAI